MEKDIKLPHASKNIPMTLSQYWTKGVLSVFGLLVIVNIVYVVFMNDFPPYAINVDGEGNIPVLLSVIIFLSIFVPLIFLMIQELRFHKRFSVVLGLGLAIFSVVAITVDEVLTFHELVVGPMVRENLLCPYFNICHAGRLWVVAYFPIGLFVAFCLLDLFRILDPRGQTRAWMMYGVLAFLLVILLELAEFLWSPYVNFVQEFVEVFGAMMFFRVFAHLAYGQH